MLSLLFGSDPAHAKSKTDLDAAYSLRKYGNGNGGSLTEDSPTHPTDWELAQPVITIGIAELTAHQPVPANNGAYYLHASLRLGADKFEHENNVVWIGLREVTIVFQSDGYQLAQASLLGERATHEYVHPGAGQLCITGPLDQAGAIAGSPFGEDHLGIIERKASGVEIVHLRALAGFGDFTVRVWGIDEIPAQAVVPEASAKRAVLDALIANALGRDGRGRVELAHAWLRKPDPAKPGDDPA